MIRLLYKGNGRATIVRSESESEVGSITDTFDTVDLACNFLTDSLNIPDDVVDDAIIKLFGHRHTVATFTQDGKLHSTSFY